MVVVVVVSLIQTPTLSQAMFNSQILQPLAVNITNAEQKPTSQWMINQAYVVLPQVQIIAGQDRDQLNIQFSTSATDSRNGFLEGPFVLTFFNGMVFDVNFLLSNHVQPWYLNWKNGCD